MSPIASRLDGAEPDMGEDRSEWLARTLATPLVALGVVTIVASVAVGIAAGINVGRWFRPLAHPDVASLGRSEALGQWTGATAALGIGLILCGLVLYLVAVDRAVRDEGYDTQEVLGAQPVTSRKPLTDRAAPWVMMLGAAAEVAAFVAGVVAAVRIGEVNPASIAAPATATPADLARIGVARAASVWLPGLRLAGIGVLLAAVVLALMTIQHSLRFQAARIYEITAETRTRFTVPSPATRPDPGEDPDLP